MLRSGFNVINSRNTPTGDDPNEDGSAGAASEPDIRPLNARSLILSVLLGAHPPRLPASALVALGERFGIASGTTRTALSRLVAAGELTSDDAWYELATPLLERQRSQDAGRRSPNESWNGAWHTAICLDDRRSVTDRRRDRRRLTDHRLGELRPDVWMRPANLGPPDLGDGWSVVTGPRRGASDRALVARLWDLDALAATAARLRRMLLDADAAAEHAPDRFETIPGRFDLAAAVLRFLRSEPLLPAELVDDGGAVDALRSSYARSETVLQDDLRELYRRG